MTQENKDYEQLLSKIGGFGWFQFQATAAMFCCINGCSFLLQNMNLLELVPKYKCNLNGVWSDCEPKDFCGTNIER